MAEFKKSNYRKKYLEYFKLEDDNKFQVHHLDFNRENNKLNNLVLLPKELHEDLHNSYSRSVSMYKNEIRFSVNDFSRIVCNGCYIKEFINLSQTIFNWIQLKSMNYDYSNIMSNIYYRRTLYLEERDNG